MGRRRVGLFGGTFDPPHLGHLVIAAEVRNALGLDEVAFVVANDPWQKSSVRSVSPAPVRLEMTRAVVAGTGRRWLRVDDVEVRRGGPTYTVDTVESWLAEDPEVEPVLIVGADAAAGLDTWHGHDRLAALVEVAVVARPGTELRMPPPPWRSVVVDTPLVEVSSTMLRARLRLGRPTDFLLPDGARAVVDRVGLYRVGP